MHYFANPQLFERDRSRNRNIRGLSVSCGTITRGLRLLQTSQKRLGRVVRFQSDKHAHRNGGAGQTGLFSAACVWLPAQLRPGIKDRLCGYLRGRAGNSPRSSSLILISVTDKSDHFGGRQLSLPLEPSHRPGVFHIVPAIRRALLDYGVYDQFRDIPDAAGPALRLEYNGVCMLGQLVQMSEEALRCYPFIDDCALTAMKANLAKFDLCFGMRHPAWNRRMKNMVAVNL